MPLFAFLNPNEANTVAREMHTEWNTQSGSVTINAGGPKKWGDLGTYFPLPPKKKADKGDYKKDDYKKDGSPTKDDGPKKPDPVKTLSADRLVRIVPVGKVTIPVNYQAVKAAGYDDKKPAAADGDKKPSSYGDKSYGAAKTDVTASIDLSKNTPAPVFSAPVKEGDCVCLKNGSLVKSAAPLPAPLVGTPQSPNAGKPTPPPPAVTPAPKPIAAAPAPAPIAVVSAPYIIESSCYDDYYY